MKRILTLSGLIMIVFSFMACNISGVNGSSNVIKKDREITESFNAVKVSQGIDVYLKQGDKVSLMVEADDNIHELLITEVKNNVLHIYFKENVGKVKSKKIYLTMTEIVALTASSGAGIESKGLIKSDKLELNASSGADINLEVEADEIICDSSSGSDIDLKGVCNKIDANSSSGSDINAKELKANHVKANSSSGSDIEIYAVESINADASSGADIKYSGSPKEVAIDKSSGGSVHKN